MKYARVFGCLVLLSWALGMTAMAAGHGPTAFTQISERVWSGPRPLAEDFARLRELGVHTVINVDGARPQVEAAKAEGLRYIHIPIGYDGIPDEAAAALAKVLKEYEGPFYIHCHHGKHRGPAMAAVALRLEEAADAAAARQVMESAGTSPDYVGLWRDVAEFDPARIAGLDPELHEVAPVGRMAEAMAAIDLNWDHLQLLQENDWKPLADHPDVLPEEEAKQILETYQALLRTGRYREDFGKLLVTGIVTAEQLHLALQTDDAAARTVAMTAAKAACTACHTPYRNAPGADYSLAAPRQ